MLEKIVKDTLSIQNKFFEGIEVEEKVRRNSKLLSDWMITT